MTEPCGHPTACIVSDWGGTSHCGWCEEVARSRTARLLLESYYNLVDGDPAYVDWFTAQKRGERARAWLGIEDDEEEQADE